MRKKKGGGTKVDGAVDSGEWGKEELSFRREVGGLRELRMV